MKIAVWNTSHSIADTIADVVIRGLKLTCHSIIPLHTDKAQLAADFDLNIGYGILRGMQAVFRHSKHYIHLDKGYFRPGHFNGYYRISHNGTQQTKLATVPTDPRRLNESRIDILPRRLTAGLDKILVCPPTTEVCKYFNINQEKWLNHTAIQYKDKVIIRHKDSLIPLSEHLAQARKVITFNSSVGWEALRQGIEVVSDPHHSIVGAWQKELDIDNQLDLDSRHKFFAKMENLQLNLREIESGLLWPLIQNLISI